MFGGVNKNTLAITEVSEPVIVTVFLFVSGWNVLEDTL
jgi:hypothetical protein